MGKSHQNKNLQRTRASRSLLAVSLAASLAAFGCSTNYTLGDGVPDRSGPEVQSAPTSGINSGSERPTPPPVERNYLPPMTSSSRVDASALNVVRTSSRADRAAAIMAQHQGAQGRYLGVVNPGLSGRGYHSDAQPTGQWVNPAMLANPQQTINSSISSRPNEAIASGAGTSDLAPTIASDNPTATTPTGAAMTLAPGTFAAGTTATPTTAIGALPTVTAVSGLNASGAPIGTTAPNTVVSAGPTTTQAVTASPSVVAPTSAGVRVVRSTSGVTVTNTNTTGAGNAAGRSQ